MLAGNLPLCYSTGHKQKEADATIWKGSRTCHWDLSECSLAAAAHAYSADLVSQTIHLEYLGYIRHMELWTSGLLWIICLSSPMLVSVLILNYLFSFNKNVLHQSLCVLRFCLCLPEKGAVVKTYILQSWQGDTGCIFFLTFKQLGQICLPARW